MRRKVLFLIILILVGLLVIGLIKILQGSAPKLGVFRVESDTPVSVFLNDRLIGISPLEEKIDEGEYTVKLVPETTVKPLSTWQGKVMIFRNLLTYLKANPGDSEFSTGIDILRLEKIQGKNSELSIITNPDGATLSLDNIPKGSTPLILHDTTVGDHTITVDSPGFISRHLKLKTTEGYRLIASMKLALAQGNISSESGMTSDSLTEAVSSTPTPSGSARVTPTKKPTGSLTPMPTASTDSDPDKPYVTIKDTPTGFLRVRFEPSTAASEAGRVSPGEKFGLLDEKSGWYQINYNVEDTGWISGQYAEKIE